MHPLLKRPKNFVLLLLIWLPVLLGYISLESTISGTPWLHALLLFGPVMMLQLFIVVSIWYVCRTIPLDAHNIVNFIFKHGGTAIIITAIWLQITMMYSEGLVLIYRTEIWREYFNKAFPLLMATGFLFYFLSSLLHYLLISQEDAQKAEQEAVENKLLASHAELESLKSTIHPHFLFNSLTALSTLTVTSPDKAQKMCLQLSDFLRYSLQYSQKEFTTIKDEVEHTKNYLNVEQIRLGNRLSYSFDVDRNAEQIRVLPFTLLPLVENAVKHGIQDRVLGGSIQLEAKLRDDNLFVRVTNPCDEERQSKQTEGHGLSVLQKRLDTTYKGEAELFAGKQNDNFVVRLYVPTKTLENPVENN